MRNVQEIGEAIAGMTSELVTALLMSGLTAEELASFEDYLGFVESAGFIADPTLYRQMLHQDDFSAVRARLGLIKKVMALYQVEKTGPRQAALAELEQSAAEFVAWRKRIEEAKQKAEQTPPSAE